MAALSPTLAATPVITHDVLEVSESPDASPCVSVTNLKPLTKRASSLHDASLLARTSWDSATLTAKPRPKHARKSLPAASQVAETSHDAAESELCNGSTKVQQAVNGEAGKPAGTSGGDIEVPTKQKPEAASDASLLKSSVDEPGVEEVQLAQAAELRTKSDALLSWEFLVQETAPGASVSKWLAEAAVPGTVRGIGASKEDCATNSKGDQTIVVSNKESSSEFLHSGAPQDVPKDDQKEAPGAEEGHPWD